MLDLHLSARRTGALAFVRAKRRDAVAAYILATVAGLIITVVPALGTGTLSGPVAAPEAPAAAAALPASTRTVTSAIPAKRVVIVPIRDAGVQFVTHGAVSIDRAAAPARSSAASPAHATSSVKSAAAPAKVVRARAVPASGSAPAPTGKNHFWFPAIGISDAVHNFNCAGSYVIPAGIWHFGCNGPRNIYLMSHAWSDFSAVRVAYHAGTLRTGMTAYYAGPDGKVLRYRVAWIRHVTVQTFNAGYWIWAINDVPAVTLQTCDGANSEYRIIVRLVRG